jgi:copper chaperone CopZ
MTCGHCVSRAQHVLEQTPGVAHVQVQLDTPQATIAFSRESIGLEALQGALNDLGYRIEPFHPTNRTGTWSGKVVWVTGASSGIGKATAMEFAQRGARVVLSARRANVLDEVIAQAPAAYRPDLVALPLDLAQSDTLEGKVLEALEAFGQIDAVVHCGGISQRSLAQDTELEVDRRVMEVDYFGTVALTKAVLPVFLARGSGHFVVATVAQNTPCTDFLKRFGPRCTIRASASQWFVRGSFARTFP